MKKHRFIGNFNLSSEHLIVDDVELSSQLAKVLRLKEGDEVVLCDGRGFEAHAEIRSLRKMSVSFRLRTKYQVETEPEKRVTLYCSILKRENFELAVQKATELGVFAIVPVLSARTVKQEINPARLAKIMREAAEQSGRGVVPELKAPLAFTDAIDEGRKYDERLFFHLSGELFGSQKRKGASVGLFIGPEGGWEESEVASARERDFAIISFGPLTLRAETAAIVASYLSREE